jgi:hypothetical protein
MRGRSHAHGASVLTERLGVRRMENWLGAKYCEKYSKTPACEARSKEMGDGQDDHCPGHPERIRIRRDRDANSNRDPKPTSSKQPRASQAHGSIGRTLELLRIHGCVPVRLTNEGNRRPGAGAKRRTRGVRVDREVRQHSRLPAQLSVRDVEPNARDRSRDQPPE